LGFSYKVLRVGQLMTDKFRYPNEKRMTICTSTLLQRNDTNILIDPGWHDDEILYALEECGLSTRDIHLIYLTHLHPDHIRSCHLFSHCKWIAPKKEVENWMNKISEEDRYILKQVQSVEGNQLVDGLKILETPGHTLGHTSLSFVESNGKIVVVAADAVLTKDYFHYREVHPNSEDKEQAVKSIEIIEKIADIIIPGHDKPFTLIKKDH
jgi:glyoxylase-like metal-dependent hydrolase (beta-lactamase superfamily II)